MHDNRWQPYRSRVLQIERTGRRRRAGDLQSLFPLSVGYTIKGHGADTMNPEVQHQRLRHAVETNKETWEIYRSTPVAIAGRTSPGGVCQR